MHRVLLDACVLVPVSLCDTLLRAAEKGLYTPLWSDEILDEVRRALHRVEPHLGTSRVESRFRLMNLAFDNARVTGHLGTVPGLQLPDPDDRHVVSAAVLAGASAIVTANIKDFPADVLAEYDLAVMTPDEFLVDLLESDPDAMSAVIDQQAADT